MRFCVSSRLGGEAESYEGVKVTYVHGQTAVLTIYQDGKEKETITMHKLKDRAAMHALMLEKGFKKKSPEEIEKMQKERREKEAKERQSFEERKRLALERREKAMNQLNLIKPVEAGDERKQLLRQGQLNTLHSERESEGTAAALLRRKEKEMLVSIAAGPNSSTMTLVALVGAASMVGVFVIGVASRRSKRSRTGLK